MGSVTAKADIALDRATMWQGLRDLTRAQFYVPRVTRIEITTPIHEGVGASRRVFQTSGAPLDETVVAWSDGKGIRFRLHHGAKPPPPFAEAWFEYGLADRDGAETELSCTLEYRLRGGMVGRLVDRLFFRRIIAKTMRALADASKRHYETGAIINPDYAGPAKDSLKDQSAALR